MEPRKFKKGETVFVANSWKDGRVEMVCTVVQRGGSRAVELKDFATSFLHGFSRYQPTEIVGRSEDEALKLLEESIRINVEYMQAVIDTVKDRHSAALAGLEKLKGKAAA